MDAVVEPEPLRPAISWAVGVCLAVAMAPWLSGGQEPLALLLSGFALLLGAVLLVRQPDIRQLKSGPLVVAYLALVGWGLLSLIWTANRYSTISWLIPVIMAGVAFRLAYAVCGEADGRRRLIWLYLGSAVAVVAYGLYLYLGGGYDRLTSSFYWPNPAAAYLIPAMFVAYDAWRRGGHWLNAVLAVLFGTGFVLTGSRAAGLVVVFLAVIYCLCISLKKRFWITLLFTVVASIGLSYAAVWLRHELAPKATITTPGSRLAPAAANGSVQSGSDRLKYLESALNIWANHPLIGTGAGTFADLHPYYQQRVVSASTSAHNEYAQVLSELGLIGALILLWLMVILSVGTVRGLWVNPLGLAAALGALGLWLHFGLDIDAQYPALILLVGTLGGALYYQRPAYQPFSWRVPIMAVVVLVPVVGLYFSDTWTIRGVNAQANGDYEVAAADFQRAHGYIFYNPNVLTAEGINRYTLAQTGEPGETTLALALARSAARQDPNDSQHYQLEGRILEMENNNSAAEAAFRQALHYDPYNHPEYAYDLALLQARNNQPILALATAKTMLAQYPPAVVANRAADPAIAQNLAELQVLVGTIHLQSGDLTDAKADSVAALKFDSGSVRAQAFKAVLQQDTPASE